MPDNAPDPSTVASADVTLGQSPELAAFEAVEISIRRLRVLACALLVGVAITGRAGLSGALSNTATATLLCLPVLLLGANHLSRRLSSAATQTLGLVIAQLAADSVAAVAVIWVLNPSNGSYALVIAGLPVLHGALRYRLSGAFLVWLAVGAGLGFRVIVQWTPGSGLQPLVNLAIPMAIALAAAIPAGHLADQLTEEILHLRGDRVAARTQARLLAVLTVAAQDLVGNSRSQLGQTAVDAAVELGLTGAALYAANGHGQPSLIAASGPPPPRLPDSNEMRSKPGHLSGIDPGLWVSQLQESGEMHWLLVWSDPSESPSVSRQEALELLCRNVAAAFTTAQGYEDLAAANAKNRYEATHDPLTGILNRSGLLEAYQQRQRRIGIDSAPFAVLVLDLNGFKGVNDTYGHEAGDTVLVAAAARLKGALPNLVGAARTGGDEFVFLVDLDPEYADRAAIAAATAALAEPFQVGLQAVSVGASVGSHIVRSVDVRAEDAIRAADVEMYRVKHARTAVPTPAHRP